LTDVTIRSAVEADAADIAAIHTASWRDAYAGILAPEFLNGDIETDRLDLWSRRLSEPPPSQLVDVARHATGAMVAFACSYHDADARWGSLVDNLHVLPRLRGQGVGEKTPTEHGRATGGTRVRFWSSFVGVRSQCRRPALLRAAWRSRRRAEEVGDSSCERDGRAARALA
jgi:ribosomal protein S18 acetylase RimI-like enzyme